MADGVNGADDATEAGVTRDGEENESRETRLGERLVPYEAEHGRQDVYEVFVQWQRGKPHEHAETVNAPDPDMALMLAKRNIDLRSEPVDIWVAPRRAMRRIRPGDSTVVPSTDRSYRRTHWYAENNVEVE